MAKTSLIAAVIVFLCLSPCVFAEDLPTDNNGEVEEPALPVINSEPEMPEVEGGITGSEPVLPSEGSVTQSAAVTAQAEPMDITIPAETLPSAKTAALESSIAAAKGHFNAGKNLYKSLDFKNALVEFSAAAALYPAKNAPPAMAAMASKCRAEIKKTEKRIKAVLSGGDRYFAAGKYNDALQEYGSALKLDKNNPEISGKITAASNALKTQVETLLAGALADAQGNKIVEAVAGLRAVKKLDPYNKTPDERLAVMDAQIKETLKKLGIEGLEQYTSQHYDEAIACWEKALVLNPGDADLQDKISRTKNKLEYIEKMTNEKK
jgi:tetratricopeptide (TPR) repeat protein